MTLLYCMYSDRCVRSVVSRCLPRHTSEMKSEKKPQLLKCKNVLKCDVWHGRGCSFGIMANDAHIIHGVLFSSLNFFSPWHTLVFILTTLQLSFQVLLTGFLCHSWRSKIIKIFDLHLRHYIVRLVVALSH